MEWIVENSDSHCIATKTDKHTRMHLAKLKHKTSRLYTPLIERLH